MKPVLCFLTLAAGLLAVGCKGEPEPVVGDNPNAANGRPASEVSTPAQRARREAAAPKGSPW